MKLLVRGLFACATLAAGMVFTSCSSPLQDQLFGDNFPSQISARPPAVGRKIAGPPNAADVARFHVGDSVTVSYSGIPMPMPDYVESIKEDGTITPPFIGPIYAVGKTAGELQREIYTNYVPKYFVRLNVTVKSGDRFYYVGGEVAHSSLFQYVSGTTVTKAIQAAGGLTDFANHGKVWLTHASNHERIRVNYDDAIKNPSKDPPVYPDDQINVQKRVF
jgi:protein involved in polysaccharide export with SLBB domain